jgi:D-cysteine desulfhydrase
VIVPPLFKRFPALGAKLPYVALGSLPTPIEKAERLGEALHIPELYVKRDDRAGEAYGGSKVRKLEFILGEAKRLGRTTVITFGAAGSNHAVATAMYAKRLGMKAILMLMPQPTDDEVRHRLLAASHFGAEIQIKGTLKQAKASAARLVRGAAPGAEPYIVEVGGSSPLGNVGLVNAAFELKEQIAAGKMPEPDLLYIALGTMGSAAGLMLGVKAAGLKTVVVSVRASSLQTSSEQKLIAMYNETNDYLRSLDPSFPKIPLARGEARIAEGYLGAGYALPSLKGTRAIESFKAHTDIQLEPTYTGKAFAAVMGDAERLRGKVVLFWNTYGARKLDLGGADPSALPPHVRGYFKSAPRSPR